MDKFFNFLRKLFQRKSRPILQPSEIETILLTTTITLDLHQQAMSLVIADVKKLNEFRDLVANAVSHLDSRLESLEKTSTFIYEKLQEIEQRIDDSDATVLEEKLTSFEGSFDSEDKENNN